MFRCRERCDNLSRRGPESSRNSPRIAGRRRRSFNRTHLLDCSIAEYKALTLKV